MCGKQYKIWGDGAAGVPTVYTNSFDGDGEELWQTCHEVGCGAMNLVVIYNFDFDNCLTPWPAEGVRHGQEPFRGEADEHLRWIVDNVVPSVESDCHPAYSAIAGYSLAGLFALYAAWQTNLFCRVACASASLWYPRFIEYLKANKPKTSLDSIYFSLGDREHKTHHPLMRHIRECTDETFSLIKRMGIKTTFELNPGNHFAEPNKRLAKAIRWLVEVNASLDSLN